MTGVHKAVEKGSPKEGVWTKKNTGEPPLIVYTEFEISVTIGTHSAVVSHVPIRVPLIVIPDASVAGGQNVRLLVFAEGIVNTADPPGLLLIGRVTNAGPPVLGKLIVEARLKAPVI